MGQINRIGSRVRGMFFSGTGTTEKIVTAVADGIARSSDRFCRIQDIDFTPPRAREQFYRFAPEDILVFGVPVIAGRVPNVLLPFLNTLEGGGAMAIPVVLYGNRNFDDALIELRNILEERGFHKARHEAANETVDTGSSHFNIMVSASGFILAVSQHIKE